MSALIRRRHFDSDGSTADFGHPVASWPWMTYCPDCGRMTDFITPSLRAARAARALHNRVVHSHRTVCITGVTTGWVVEEFTWGDGRDAIGLRFTWEDALKFAALILASPRDAEGHYHGLLVSDATTR